MELQAESTVQLPSGAEMPVIGLGTWQMEDEEAVKGVVDALEQGYRMIDTSGDYGNQTEIADAIADAPVTREEVFLVTKVEENEDAYDSAARKAVELGVETVDLCLLHRPPEVGAGEDLWRGLIEACGDGIARDIGVSNYSAEQLDTLIEATGEVPAVNQVEWSPFGHSDALMRYANEHGIVIQAYSPLTRGDRLGNDRVEIIAERHGKTDAQVLLRWSLQSGAIPIPKASDPRHREENFDIFDFELDDGEMAMLHKLNERYSALSGLSYV